MLHCMVSLSPSASLKPPAPEELPCPREGGRENLLHQAMQNSGIVLERVAGEEGALEAAPASGSSPQPLGDKSPELPLLEVEPMETVGVCAPLGVGHWCLFVLPVAFWSDCPLVCLCLLWGCEGGCQDGPLGLVFGTAGAEPAVGVRGLPVILQQMSSEASTVPKTHPCPQCSETFPTAATLEAHKRGHAGGWVHGQ